MLQLYFASTLFTAIVGFGLAALLRAKDNPRLTAAWRAAMCATALWTLGRAMVSIATTPGAAMFWVRASYCGSVELSFLWVWLTYAAAGRSVPRVPFVISSVILAVFIGTVFTPYFIPTVKPKMCFQYYDDSAGLAFHAWLVFFDAWLIWAFVVMVREMRRSRGVVLNRLRYVMLSGIFGFIGAGTTFPLVQNIPVYPFGVTLVAFCAILLTYAVVRHRLMDFNLASRFATIYLCFGLLMGVPVAFLVLLCPFSAINAMIVLASATLSPWLYSRFKMQLTATVDRLPPFRKRYDRYRGIDRYEKAIRESRTVDEWAHRTAQATAEVFGVEKVNLLYRDATTETYLIKAGVGFKASSPDLQLLELPEDDPLIHRLGRNSVVVRELLDEPGECENPKDIRARMDFVHAAICVPLVHDGKLLAVLNVGEKKDRGMYNDLDLSTLWNLVGAAQGTLWTILSALSQRERSAMWAHDIAHVFGPNGSYFLLDEAIKGAEGPLRETMLTRLQLARNDYEFLRKVYRQVLNGQDYEFFDMKPNSLAQAYTRMKEKYTGVMVHRGLAFMVHIPPEDLKVMCDDLRIEYQVLMNLVENAARYTLRGGLVEMGWRTEGGYFVGFVRDTGIGVPEKDLGRIFEGGYRSAELEARKKGLRPDDKGGRGIGLSSAAYVVKKQGGGIWAESVSGKGSTFSFKLPLAESGGQS